MVKLKETVGTFINTVIRFLEGGALSKIEDEFSSVGTFAYFAEITYTLLSLYLRISLLQTLYRNLFSLLVLVELLRTLVEVGIRVRKKYDGEEVGFKISEYIGDIKFTIVLGVIEFLKIAVGRAPFDMKSVLLLAFYLSAKLIILCVDIFLLESIFALTLKITYSNFLRGWIIKFDHMIRAWVENDSDDNNDSHGGMSDGIPIPIIVSIVQSYTKLEKRLSVRLIMDAFDYSVKQIQRITRKEYKQTKKTRLLFWSFCYLVFLFAFFTMRTNRLYNTTPLRIPPLINRDNVLYVNTTTFLIKYPMKKPPNKNSILFLPSVTLCRLHSIILT